MRYRIFTTTSLDRKLRKMGFSQWHRLEKLKRKLETDPFTGKRLGKDLFEKKWGPFRIYYIIFEDILMVVLVEFGNKKEQRRAIYYILANWDQTIQELRKSFS